jgi:tripeptidyl-peptidase-1
MLYRSLVVALAAGLASAKPGVVVTHEVPDSHVLHEEQQAHWANSWEQGERLDKSTILPMRFGLKQSNLDEGHQMLLDM